MLVVVLCCCGEGLLQFVLVILGYLVPGLYYSFLMGRVFFLYRARFYMFGYPNIHSIFSCVCGVFIMWFVGLVIVAVVSCGLFRRAPAF